MNDKNNIEITYTQADGTKTKLKVSLAIAETLSMLVREENRIEKSIQRHESFTSYSEIEELITKRWLDDTAETVEISAEKRIQRKELMDAMEALDPVHHRRIYMRFFLDMKYEEIAKVEKVTYQSVIESINNGLKKLKEML